MGLSSPPTRVFGPQQVWGAAVALRGAPPGRWVRGCLLLAAAFCFLGLFQDG